MDSIINGLEAVVSALEHAVWGAELPGLGLPWLAVFLIATGIYLTLRMGFIQVRKLGHATAVALGKYDDPNDKGDISHFQALTTALSATVGIGNIAGVALAIHWGGPGAIFWMWVTAVLGMCTKYTEVTLAMRHRNFDDAGHASGGPQHYIHKGLGARWKPLAIAFAGCAVICSFATGNMNQVNTLAKTVDDAMGIPPLITGFLAAALIGGVIFGGIKMIGKVTSVLSPLMALLYVGGAIAVLVVNAAAVPGAFATIVAEAFNPTAGVAGTAAGAISMTLLWGVKRGLFSNEAGQGSAPIAHSAAKSSEPLSEGLVALLEPFIDTLIICTMTGLVIITCGLWDKPLAEDMHLGDKEITVMTWLSDTEPTLESFGVAMGRRSGEAQIEMAGKRRELDELNESKDASVKETLIIREGRPHAIRHHDGSETKAILVKNNCPIFFTNADQGIFAPATGEASGTALYSGEIPVFDGKLQEVNALGDARKLRGDTVRIGAALTNVSFESALGGFGRWIVTLTVILFALSTAISWSYYGDRCTEFLFGLKGVPIYRILYLVFVVVGANAELATVWTFGDVTLGLMTIPNLIALILLASSVRKMQDDYFDKLKRGVIHRHDPR